MQAESAGHGSGRCKIGPSAIPLLQVFNLDNTRTVDVGKPRGDLTMLQMMPGDVKFQINDPQRG
jgi:hypothetical protein